MTAYSKKTVYLAGPITGLTHDGARYGWRLDFSDLLADMGLDHISCSSPMRGKMFLKHHGILSSGHDYPKNPLASSEGITTRDYNDIRECSAMVACYLDSGNRPSLGTAVEYGYCWALHKPVVTIGPEDDVNIRHAMLKRMSGYRVDTLEEAANIVGLLLTPGI